MDLRAVRSAFPGLATDWAYFDNAGGTQIAAHVVERMTEFLYERNVQIGGSYPASLRAAEAMADAREAMRALVNAERPEEIVFSPSSTVALQNLASAMRAQLEPGDEIVVTVADHESNIGPWARLEEHGVVVKTWPLCRDSLRLRLEDLDGLMTARTRLVAVTHVSNILGTINPIAEIAARVHERGAQICVDSVAFAPHRAIDVRELDVDYLVFSLYKVFGPHNAVMYGRYPLLRELDNLYHYFYGKDKVPQKLEPGNANYELAYGSIGVVDYLAELGAASAAAETRRSAIVAAYAAIERHEAEIGERLLGYLRARPDVSIVGAEDGRGRDRVPTISFKVRECDSGDIARRIDDHRVAIRFGDFHARRLVEYLGLAPGSGVVRVSMAHYNEAREVDALTAALDAVLP